MIQDKRSTIRVMGVDPGYERLGLAVVEKGRREKLLFSACVTTDSKSPFPERLLKIGGAVRDVLQKYKPDGVAIECAFFNTNQKTALGVAEAAEPSPRVV